MEQVSREGGPAQPTVTGSFNATQNGGNLSEWAVTKPHTCG